MAIITLALACLATAAEGDVVEREKLVRVLDDGWAQIEDIEFIYEGSTRIVQPEDVPTTDHISCSFQGTFAFRPDHSLHQDIFIEPKDATQPLGHEVWSLFKGNFGRRSTDADHPSGVGGDEQFRPKSSISGINRSPSALQFMLSPELRGFLKEFHHFYRSVGWEEIAGRRCLVIEISTAPFDSGKQGLIDRFWIDLERGGNPLQREVYVHGKPWMSVTDIALEEYTDDRGRKVWIPVRGRTHSFLKGPGEFSSKPVIEDTYRVVKGTVRLNQGLSDDRFSLDRSVKPATERLIKLKSQFDAKRRHAKVPGPQEQVDRLLAAADRQAKRLEASAPSRGSWAGRNVASLVLVGGGILAIALAGIWRRMAT